MSIYTLGFLLSSYRALECVDITGIGGLWDLHAKIEAVRNRLDFLVKKLGLSRDVTMGVTAFRRSVSTFLANHGGTTIESAPQGHSPRVCSYYYYAGANPTEVAEIKNQRHLDMPETACGETKAEEPHFNQNLISFERFLERKKNALKHTI